MAKGEVILLDFRAPQFSTSRAQERVLDARRDETPAYEAIRFIVNMDTDDPGELARSLDTVAKWRQPSPVARHVMSAVQPRPNRGALEPSVEQGRRSTEDGGG
ncbi:hypothetical protein [Rubellimicrobium roseum]|uniref:hypothetical protein n=1 Tax=Rubellimicrobium roseum TaxID=687525 RepID=UPI00159BC772|nr:hypothetical protein [Rubellimicrobium roseum]